MKKTIANNPRRRQVAISLLKDAYRHYLARTPHEARYRDRDFAVCCAIESAELHGIDSIFSEQAALRESVSNELAGLIHRSLKGHEYITDWLMAQDARIAQYINRERMRLGLDVTSRGLAQIPRVVRYRREWVRNMIYVLEQGGNL